LPQNHPQISPKLPNLVHMTALSKINYA